MRIKGSYIQYSPYNDLLAIKTLVSIVTMISRYACKGIISDLNVLDIGCGIGGISFPLSYLGCKVVGTDIHAESIKECNRKNTYSNANYFVADGTSLDIGRQFDVVICAGVLEHVVNYMAVLKTIRLHLSKGSIAIINIPNGYSFYETLFSRLFVKLKIGKLLHMLPGRLYTALTGSSTPYHSFNIFCDHVNFFSLMKFKRILAESGFEILDISKLGLGIFLDWWWMRPFKFIECKIADYIPALMAGSWNIVLKLK